MPTYSYLMFLTRRKYNLEGRNIANLVKDICPEVRDFESGTNIIGDYARVVIGTRGSLPDPTVAAQRLFGRLRPPAFTYGPGKLCRETWNPETSTYGNWQRVNLRFDTIRVRLKPAYREFASLVFPDLFRTEGELLLWQGAGTITDGDLQEKLEEILTAQGPVDLSIRENAQEYPRIFNCLNLEVGPSTEQLSYELAFLHDGIDVEYNGRVVIHFTPHSTINQLHYEQEIKDHLAWARSKPVGQFGRANNYFPEVPLGQTLETYFTVSDFLG